MRTPWIPVLLAAALPAGAAENSDGQWERLKQLAPNKIVRAHLSDGRVLTGHIQEVRMDGLTLVSESSLAIIRTRDVARTTLSGAGQPRTIEGRVSFVPGQSVELMMSDGSVRQGTVHSFSAADERLSLMEGASGARLDRAQIDKVTAKRSGQRVRNALIGAAGGAVILWGVGRARSDSKCLEAGARCEGTPPGLLGVMGALAGSAGGALFPVKGWTTVYQK